MWWGPAGPKGQHGRKRVLNISAVALALLMTTTAL